MTILRLNRNIVTPLKTNSLTPLSDKKSGKVTGTFTFTKNFSIEAQIPCKNRQYPKEFPLLRSEMKYFDHEKLDVYQASIELVILIDEIIDLFPRGRAYLADQLQRAGSSVPLNIAEGAGEYSVQEKVRFYRMARRSATECASIFDIGQRIQIIEQQRYLRGRELLIRIVSMLTKMVQGSSGVEIPTEEASLRGTS